MVPTQHTHHLDAAVAGGGAVAGPEDEVVHVSSEQQHCQVSPLSPVPAAHLTIFSQRSLSWLHPGRCLLLPLWHGSGNHIDFRVGNVGMSPISPHAATQLQPVNYSISNISALVPARASEENLEASRHEGEVWGYLGLRAQYLDKVLTSASCYTKHCLAISYLKNLLIVNVC